MEPLTPVYLMTTLMPDVPLTDAGYRQRAKRPVKYPSQLKSVVWKPTWLWLAR
ncbi:hypothetical protein SEEC0006_02630 [Salmonella enterica subsp. enterica serovar Choleraesuis str. 0006]|nr:hypothetical protein SEEC0006_02630 [Salmonella enterica subsp. enterica serovar Choleraesuis str. 0006]